MRSRFAVLVLAPTVAVSALLLVVGAGAAWYVHRLNQDVSNVLADNLAGVLASERLVLELRDVRLELDRYLVSGDPAYLNAAIATRREIERSFEEVQRTAIVDNPTDLNVRTLTGFRNFMAQLDRLDREATSATLMEEARHLMRILTREVISPAEQLLRQREKIASINSRRNQVIAGRIGLGFLLLGLSGAMAGLLAGYGIARGVHQSIVQLRLPVRDMAGTLNEVIGPITVSSDADLSELETAMRTLAEKTTQVVQQLQESQLQTLRAEQLAAVGQLAAGLAHELRNPLTSMKLLVQAAAERKEGAPLRARDLAVLEEEITRLDKMLQSFLDFARPPKLDKQPVDIGDLLEKSLQLAQSRALQQDVQIHCQRPHSPLWIEVDAAHMRQVFWNVLLNALDALPSGGNIWVTMATDDTDGRRVRDSKKHDDGRSPRQLSIRVADDGPGVPPDQAERIFEPFVSTKDTGIGLGLSICKQIVESHGGTISAKHRAEKGAELTIRLPFQSQQPLAEKPDAVNVSVS